MQLRILLLPNMLWTTEMEPPQLWIQFCVAEHKRGAAAVLFCILIIVITKKKTGQRKIRKSCHPGQWASLQRCEVRGSSDQQIKAEQQN